MIGGWRNLRRIEEQVVHVGEHFPNDIVLLCRAPRTNRTGRGRGSKWIQPEVRSNLLDPEHMERVTDEDDARSPTLEQWGGCGFKTFPGIEPNRHGQEMLRRNAESIKIVVSNLGFGMTVTLSDPAGEDDQIRIALLIKGIGMIQPCPKRCRWAAVPLGSPQYDDRFRRFSFVLPRLVDDRQSQEPQGENAENKQCRGKQNRSADDATGVRRCPRFAPPGMMGTFRVVLRAASLR